MRTTLCLSAAFALLALAGDARPPRAQSATRRVQASATGSARRA